MINSICNTVGSICSNLRIVKIYEKLDGEKLLAAIIV